MRLDGLITYIYVKPQRNFQCGLTARTDEHPE
jgi:hypothetical protein